MLKWGLCGVSLVLVWVKMVCVGNSGDGNGVDNEKEKGKQALKPVLFVF